MKIFFNLNYYYKQLLILVIIDLYNKQQSYN